jgi:MFS family permease
MFLDSGLELVIGTGPHISAIIVGRFFSGLLSTIPTNVVAGSIEDMYGPERRVWTIFAWGVAANIGLTIGPIYSTYISKAIGWYVNFQAVLQYC